MTRGLSLAVLASPEAFAVNLRPNLDGCSALQPAAQVREECSSLSYVVPTSMHSHAAAAGTCKTQELQCACMTPAGHSTASRHVNAVCTSSEGAQGQFQYSSDGLFPMAASPLRCLCYTVLPCAARTRWRPSEASV